MADLSHLRGDTLWCSYCRKVTIAGDEHDTCAFCKYDALRLTPDLARSLLEVMEQSRSRRDAAPGTPKCKKCGGTRRDKLTSKQRVSNSRGPRSVFGGHVTTGRAMEVHECECYSHERGGDK